MSEEAESETEVAPRHQPGVLTAGEWRDLDNWEFWRGLFGEESDVGWVEHARHWMLHPRERFAVRVRSEEVVVADARVRLMSGDRLVWEARTDNRGRADLFDGFFGESEAGEYRLLVKAGSASTAVPLSEPTGGERIDIDLTGAAMPAHALDLMFVVDTTGSMGDELSYIQSELHDVIERTRQNAGDDLSVRLSVNFYRDQGDEYVVRPFPFTSNIDKALGDLQEQSAGGGGNFPEAVDRALANALDEHEWRPDARARLLFLVLDAPPHHNPHVLEALQRAAVTAAEKGVRIVPLTASGIDKRTEYLMRALQVGTGGTYVFLTDHSGVGNKHLEPTIGDYDIERLNDLLVRVISEYSSRASDA